MIRFALLLAFVMLTTACGPDGAPNAQRQILREHVPRVKELLQLDRARHRQGIIEAAHRLRRGFLVEDPEQREREMRTVMRQLQEPPRGIGAFIVSPMSFLAAVGANGIVIARDSQEDRMKGEDFGERYPVIRAALSGEVGMGVGEFASMEEGGTPSYSILFAAPSRHNGEIVGAVVAGIPLWREAQRFSRQLRIDRANEIASGLIVWVYMYKGDRLFVSPEAPPEVTEILPDAAARAAGLQASPGGYTTEARMQIKWFGIGTVPMPTLGDDIGIIIARSDPPE